jgi:hypothetical protein
MSSISSIQNNPILAQLLAVQQAAGAGSPQAPSSSLASSTSPDSLSLSAAALQALAGQGSDPSLTPQAASTYSARGHHHHHHHSGASAQPDAAGQVGTTAQSPQIPQVESSVLQAKA